MELTGTIKQALELQTGTSAKGDWRKQQYIIETGGDYPKSVCFMVWGDKIDELDIQVGDHLKVSIDIESREYNGRWYTDVKCWSVSKLDSKQAQEDTAQEDSTEEEPDLPF